MPGGICYNTSKRFTSGIAMGLSRELKGQVDVLDYRPGLVETNILKNSNVPMIMAISAERSAQVCLRDLGYEESSACSFRHWFISYHLSFIDQFDFFRLQM